MTREKWKTMTLAERRVKIAELAGWVCIKTCTYSDMYAAQGAFSDGALDGCVGSPIGIPPGGEDYALVPRFEDDLNAMAKSVALMTDIQFCKYVQTLRGHTTPGVKIAWCGEDAGRAERATAAQRAEAFALVMEEE